jgi:hypothetical protein
MLVRASPQVRRCPGPFLRNRRWTSPFGQLNVERFDLKVRRIEQVTANGIRGASVRRELVHVPYIAEGSPHFLHNVHLLEGGLQRLGGRVHRL